MHPIARMGDSYLALIVIVLAQTLLWSAGVHGPAVLAAIVTPVYLTMQMQNTPRLFRALAVAVSSWSRRCFSSFFRAERGRRCRWPQCCRFRASSVCAGSDV